MLEPFDKTRCSFHVPDFASEQEGAWEASLTPEQRMELLYLVQIARWGEAAVQAGVDRTVMRVLTMEEFNRLKESEDAEEEEWRRANGYPPRFRRPDSNSR